MMFGTAADTYTAPGIDSPLSKARQSGPLRLATTDASGNLATDGGATFTEIAKVKAGVAIAMAMDAPTLTRSENFGLRAGWANFDRNANAYGVSAIGVICRECFVGIDRIAIDAAAGVGTSSFSSYGSGSIVGARAGAQLTW
jgi:hypothetical protein